MTRKIREIDAEDGESVDPTESTEVSDTVDSDTVLREKQPSQAAIRRVSRTESDHFCCGGEESPLAVGSHAGVRSDGGTTVTNTIEEWPVTEQGANHLADISGVDPNEIVGELAVDIEDRLRRRLDTELLSYRRICGRVVKPDPETGDMFPVPNATVHVEDTDCSHLWYCPPGYPWMWLWPFHCRREEIGTVTTDECGRFCITVPRWEIDRILQFRRRRRCLFGLVRPKVWDVLEQIELVPRREPEPRPQPEPVPIEELMAAFDEPGTFERVESVLGRQVASDIAVLVDQRQFAESTEPLKRLLDRPAIDQPVKPPLPDELEDIEELTEQDIFGAIENRLPVDEDILEGLQFPDYVGPFLRCWYDRPRWSVISDVPDITFRVTQDTNGDGTEETIYSEGFFDVRWNSSGPITDLELEATKDALAVPDTVCQSPPSPPEECETPDITSVGVMPLDASASPPYHDNSTGYALRPNRPRHAPEDVSRDAVAGSRSGRAATGEAPYFKWLTLYGCTPSQFEQAEYYRVVSHDVSGATKPLKGLEWNAITDSGGTVPISPVDDKGWYEIRTDLRDEELLLWWPTHREADGNYEVQVELGDSSKSVIERGNTVTFEIDNSKPRVDMFDIDYKLDGGTFDSLQPECPVIRRAPEGTRKAVKLQVEYAVSATHLRNVYITASGCSRNNPSLTTRPETREHWHENTSQNTYGNTAVFEVPDRLPEGTYTISLYAFGRAFNPRDADGMSADWNYDTQGRDGDRVVRRHISIIDG